MREFDVALDGDSFGVCFQKTFGVEDSLLQSEASSEYLSNQGAGFLRHPFSLKVPQLAPRPSHLFPECTTLTPPPSLSLFPSARLLIPQLFS